MFSTLMFERHNTKTAIFGGKPGEQLQYKGTFLFLLYYSTSTHSATQMQVWLVTRCLSGLTSTTRSRPPVFKM